VPVSLVSLVRLVRRFGSVYGHRFSPILYVANSFA
jgi:hypothetical protein